MYADGMNLYQYVQSNPVNRLDPSGLQSMPASAPEKPKEGEFVVKDLGKKKPQGNMAGETTVEFCPNGKPTAKPNRVTGCYKLEFVNFYGTADYWWSDEKSKTHEERHVDFAKTHWEIFYKYAKDLKDKGEYPRAIADCWLDAIIARHAAEYKAQSAKSRRMDADEYSDRFPAAAQIAKTAEKEAAVAMQKFKEIHKKCSEMK